MDFKNITFKGKFRDYQQRVLDNSDKYLKDGKINIVAAPGSGKTVQSFYSQPYSVPTLPPEYEEIRCVSTNLGLYSLKKDGKYGMAWIPIGWPEAQMVTDCRWSTPLTLTEMCAKVVGGENAVPAELPPYSPPIIDNSVKLLDGVLTWKGQRYPLPDWETARRAGANGDSLEIVGDRVLATVHINPWNSYNAVE